MRQGEGCRIHPGKPQYWPRGNVTRDADFKTEVAKWDTYIGAHYESKSAIILLPGELRDIRTHLLSHNDSYHLMLWTIIIVGVKLFLRCEEAIELTVEQFVMEYFQVDADAVVGLCAKIKGKRDAKWGHFMLWHDSECPEFSASSAVLVWLHVSGIKSGRLFPKREDLDLRRSHNDEHLQYPSFLAHLKHLLHTVAGRDVNKMSTDITGTHVLRKTGFLLAYWGLDRKSDGKTLFEMDEASILLSARHQNIASTGTYLSDSGTLKGLVDREREDKDRHKVGKWESTHMEHLNMYASIRVNSAKYRKPLPELADWYVGQVLGCSSITATLTIAQIHARVVDYTPDLSEEEELKAFLFRELSESKAELGMKLYEKSSAKRARAAQCSDASLIATSSERLIVNKSTFDPANNNSNKKCRHDPNDTVEFARDYKSEFASARAASAKVRIYVDTCADVRAQVKEGKILCEPGKSFAYRACRVVSCLESCFAGNIDEFLADNSGPLSKFKTCSKNVHHKPTFDPSKL